MQLHAASAEQTVIITSLGGGHTLPRSWTLYASSCDEKTSVWFVIIQGSLTRLVMHSLLSRSKYSRLNWTWTAVEQDFLEVPSMVRKNLGVLFWIFIVDSI